MPTHPHLLILLILLILLLVAGPADAQTTGDLTGLDGWRLRSAIRSLFQASAATTHVLPDSMLFPGDAAIRKGDAARAALYRAIFKVDRPDSTRLATLMVAHEADPADSLERARQAALDPPARNPFVYDAGLPRRAFYGTAPPPRLWINEIHYDNEGADTGEGIELAGEANLNLDFFRIYPYSGWGHVYLPGYYDPLERTAQWDFTEPVLIEGATSTEGGLDGDSLGTLWVAIPGLRNACNGLFLEDPDGHLIQFLSYGGCTFNGIDGPAIVRKVDAYGMLTVDTLRTDYIGVYEWEGVPRKYTLQLTGQGLAYTDFTWSFPIPATPGRINTGQVLGQPPDTSSTRFSGFSSHTPTPPYPHTELYPGLAGQDLTGALRADFTPDRILSYEAARDTLFARIHREAGDSLRCVYTGRALWLDPAQDPTAYAWNHPLRFSTEHTWPQSKGAFEGTPGHSDLHHLYPAAQEANTARSNYPFADIPDTETSTWFGPHSTQTSIPSTHIAFFSEQLKNASFEPREDHKGDVARSLFYFAVIYEEYADLAWFEGQVQALLAWHAADPVSPAEVARSGLIVTYQGNENPFVLDPTLAARAFSDSVGAPPGDRPATLWINELHYDNLGADTGEGVELAGSAGGSLSGYRLYFYRDDGTVYAQQALRGMLPYQSSGFGLRWFAHPGIQNGPGDGLALVDPDGSVVQFLSYEGEITAIEGPAEGLLSTNLAVIETPHTPPGYSLGLAGEGEAYEHFRWSTPALASPGALNPGQTFANVPPSVSATPIDDESELPREPVFEALYPNPVASNVAARFRVETPVTVRLELYDLLGRRVDVLEEGRRASGSHTVSFDTGGLLSGVYFVRLVADGTTKIKRLIITH